MQGRLQLQEPRPLMVEQVHLMESMRLAARMVEAKQQMALPPTPEAAVAPDTMTLYHGVAELSDI
jgi:hypothetical protein